LAKERDEIALRPGGVDRREDRVYLPLRREPLYLSRWPAALFLLQQVRDEAHRLAVAYHRRLKNKADFQSILDAIPGIGQKRKRDLLTFFGSARRIAAAPVADLQKVAGIGKETAERIRTHFNPEG
jgi:excinuclease ABC subunit C